MLQTFGTQQNLEEEIAEKMPKIDKIARFSARRFLLLKNARFFRQSKNRQKNAKNRQKTPGTHGPRDKEPDLVFFWSFVFFVCGAVREEVCGGHQAFLRCAKAG
jgi:hypothetical protein